MTLSEEDLAEWVMARREGRDRYLLGIVGPPGSGKSTVAQRLGRTIGAPVVVMDGFHRSNVELDALGLRGVKGAPETFASRAFVELVRRLRGPDSDVWCPSFDRMIDEPVPDQVRVGAEHRVVVVEGNYLLLDQPPWRELSELFDAVVYLDVADDVRVRRLVDRHVEFGKTREEASEFVERSDAANARLIEASRLRATLVVSMSAA